MGRYKTRATVLAVAACLICSGSAAAQEPVPISVEARSGVAFPTGDLSDEGADTGFLLGADVFFGLFPRFSLYGGYAWHRFGCDDCEDDVTAHGPRGGVKVRFPLTGAAVPWVRGGLSWSNSDGLGGDPDGELGLEVGGGIDFPVSPRFGVATGLHFGTFTQEFPTTELDLAYLTLELGARYNF